MEFSSHRNFITPNVLAADFCLCQWYGTYMYCMHMFVYMHVCVVDKVCIVCVDCCTYCAYICMCCEEY